MLSPEENFCGVKASPAIVPSEDRVAPTLLLARSWCRGQSDVRGTLLAEYEPSLPETAVTSPLRNINASSFIGYSVL